MNKHFVEEWLNKLKEYWFNKDIENTFYETLYNHWRNNSEWQHIKNENI